jgi:ubiquitin-like protein 4
MSELNFARSFLTTLDSKATKYQPDHVFNPQTFATRIPFTLPRLSHPPHPNPPTTSSAPAPGSEPPPRTITIVLKSARNPNLSLTLPSSNPQTTTISALRAAVQSALGGPTVDDSKIKILWNKKPVPTAKKTVADALDNPLSPASEVEFGVMVMGGAPDPPQQAQPVLTSTPAAGAQVSASVLAATEGLQKTKSPPVVQAPSGREVLSKPQFWTDLQGFLQQRLRDEEARLLMRAFEEAWRNVDKATSNL